MHYNCMTMSPYVNKKLNLISRASNSCPSLREDYFPNRPCRLVHFLHIAKGGRLTTLLVQVLDPSMTFLHMDLFRVTGEIALTLLDIRSQRVIHVIQQGIVGIPSVQLETLFLDLAPQVT